MKKIKISMIAGMLFLAAGFGASAQDKSTNAEDKNGNTQQNGEQKRTSDWTQGRKGVYSFGIGGTQVIGINSAYSFITRPGLSVNFSGEYKVHRFIGLGFQTGMMLFFEPGIVRYYPDYVVVVDRRVYMAIPIAMKMNVHILEAANARVSDRLDVYAGLNIGGGPAFYAGPPYGGVFGIVHVGPQAGVRYWVGKRLGVFGEIGWGATFANVGLSF